MSADAQRLGHEACHALPGLEQFAAQIGNVSGLSFSEAEPAAGMDDSLREHARAYFTRLAHGLLPTRST